MSDNKRGSASLELIRKTMDELAREVGTIRKNFTNETKNYWTLTARR
jgi:hypothetical protein